MIGGREEEEGWAGGEGRVLRDLLCRRNSVHSRQAGRSILHTTPYRFIGDSFRKVFGRLQRLIPYFKYRRSLIVCTHADFSFFFPRKVKLRALKYYTSARSRRAGGGGLTRWCRGAGSGCARPDDGTLGLPNVEFNLLSFLEYSSSTFALANAKSRVCFTTLIS